MLLLACTDNDSKFWATSILCAIIAFVGRLGIHSSSHALACIMFLVTEMTQGPFGVITSFLNSTSFLTILMVALESAHALSLLS